MVISVYAYICSNILSRALLQLCSCNFILTVDLYQRAFPIICTLKTIETIIYSIMIASPRMNTGVKGC